jgi:hypothetical protein
MPFDQRLLQTYEDIFGPDRWASRTGDWLLLGIKAQLLGTDSAQEADLWEWKARHNFTCGALMACSATTSARSGSFDGRPTARTS